MICKYPDSVCPHMTLLNGKTYCDTVPCQIRGELPRQTNADRIRNMTDEELAEYIAGICTCGFGKERFLKWLKSPVGSEH